MGTTFSRRQDEEHQGLVAAARAAWIEMIAQVIVPLSAVAGGVFFTLMGIKSNNKHQWKVIQEEADNKRWLENIKRERREKMLRLQQAEQAKSAVQCACPEH